MFCYVSRIPPGLLLMVLMVAMGGSLVLEVTRERSQLRPVESRRASPARNQTTFVRSQRGQKGK